MARPGLPPDSADGAQSVRRALAVLRLVATGQDRGVRLTDVARMCGLPLPTVHRLLKVLMEETAVEQDASTRRYRIGHEITLLGLARPAGLALRTVAEPALTALAAEVGDTVFLSVRHGSDSVCIGRFLGSHTIQVLSIDVGARRPLGASVSGVALLTGVEAAEAAAVTQGNAVRLQVLGRSVRQVLSAVAAAQRLGHAYAPVGVMPGTSAVAVPIRDAGGRVVGAISIATLAERLGRDRLRTVVAAMQSHVDRITARLMDIDRSRAGAHPAKKGRIGEEALKKAGPPKRA
ncbi:IclR family transcriptional regulator [Ramlibacter rhizophilus]|uniref:IclR family transcriptional regulator n=1 Tax=Ramlibacter rhizophilus TaxID=1781167 RepID=A0A4Z0BKP2_9BURK|nr:IclR family transcriptional regulator [Ramlibacter rhizophilus]TFY99892.1 IclR family transcriptional regulator [Ramlibacter rhizophilus]